jgi:hypothetical protein
MRWGRKWSSRRAMAKRRCAWTVAAGDFERVLGKTALRQSRLSLCRSLAGPGSQFVSLGASPASRPVAHGLVVLGLLFHEPVS